MRYGLQSPAYDCQSCNDKKRTQSNCHNRQKRIDTIIAKPEWGNWPSKLKHVAKWGKGITTLKFYECPKSAITNKTWEILNLIDETTEYNASSKNTSIAALPFEGAWLDQPDWYRQAFKIVKHERLMFEPPETKGK